MVTTFLFSRVTGLRDVTVSFKQTDLCLHVTDFNVPQQERIPCYEEVLLAQGDSYSHVQTRRNKRIRERAHIEALFMKGNRPLTETQKAIGQTFCLRWVD